VLDPRVRTSAIHPGSLPGSMPPPNQTTTSQFGGWTSSSSHSASQKSPPNTQTGAASRSQLAGPSFGYQPGHTSFTPQFHVMRKGAPRVHSETFTIQTHLGLHMPGKKTIQQIGVSVIISVVPFTVLTHSQNFPGGTLAILLAKLSVGKEERFIGYTPLKLCLLNHCKAAHTK